MITVLWIAFAILLIALIAIGYLCMHIIKQLKKKADVKIESKERESLAIAVEKVRNELANVKSSLSQFEQQLSDTSCEISKLQKANKTVNEQKQVSSQNSGKHTSVSATASDLKSEVYYSSNVSVASDGSLAIPMSVLSKTDNGQLFKISLSSKGNGTYGTYTLNPSCRDIRENLDKISRFSTGLESVNPTMKIKVEAQGKLTEENGMLIISDKLRIIGS